MASVVRETPRVNASSEPSAATPAPTRTTGTSQGVPAARTASATGAVASTRASDPSTARTATATHAYTTSVMPKASGIPRGMVRAGSRTSSPRVAITGVPGERAEQQTGRLEHAARTARGPDAKPPCIGLTRHQTPDHHGSEDSQDHRHDHARQPRGLLDSAVVHRGQRHHGRDRHGVLLSRPDVRAHGERHRRTGGRLADRERPAREITPEHTPSRSRPYTYVPPYRQRPDTERRGEPTTWRCSRRPRRRRRARGAARILPREPREPRARGRRRSRLRSSSRDR